MTRRTLGDDQALSQARTLEKQGQPEQAKRVYSQILERNPQNKKARKALKALQALGKSQLTPGDFERIVSLMKSGRLEAARAEANRLARSHPNEPAILNLLGVVLTRVKRTREAIEEFQHALALQPDFVDARNNLGAAFLALGEFSEAEACYRAVLEATPEDADAWFNLANSLRQRQALTDAAQCYQRSLELRPFSAQAYYNLGRTLSDLGKPEQAITSYERALNIREDFVPARMLMGGLLSSLGRMVAAAECFHLVLQKEPDNLKALIGLGNAQHALGSKLAARESYARARDVAPDNETARHLLDAMDGRSTERAPQSYVRDVFDTYAGGFEQALTGQLGYDAPRTMRKLIEQWKLQVPVAARAIDLGCGTGLGGEAFREFTQHLSGVDLSSRMLREAGRKGIYDSLLEGDVLEQLQAGQERYELILSFDMLIYLGRLESIFQAISSRLAAGGLVLCSTEDLDSEEDYTLRSSGRYAHSQRYLQHCAEAAGLQLAHYASSELRKDNDRWLQGGFYCFTTQ